MTPTIRRAHADDASVLARLNGLVQSLHHDGAPEMFKAPDPDPAPLTELFRSWLADPSIHILIADDSGYVLARHATIEENALQRSRSALLLDQIAVVPDERRRGTGSALVDAVMALAAELEVETVTLSVWEFNAGARAFFESVGFRPQHTQLARPVD